MNFGRRSLQSTLLTLPAPAPALALALALAAALPLAGCGDDSSPIKETQSEESPVLKGQPLGPAEARESAGEGAKRIAKSIKSSDCKVVNTVNPLSRPGLSTTDRCKYLRARLDLKVEKTERFEGAATIDYVYGSAGATALLVRDSDGLFHVDAVDVLLDGQGKGSKPAPGFKPAADKAVKALRLGDCKALFSVVHRRLGLGASGKAAVCTYAKNNPIPALYASYPSAKLVSLGGNDDYAFYSLSSPEVTYTIVLAREQDPPDLPKGFPRLPKDAPTYGLVDVLETNRAS